MARAKTGYELKCARQQELRVWEQVVKNNIDEDSINFFKKFIADHFGAIYEREWVYLRNRIRDLITLYNTAQDSVFCRTLIIEYCNGLSLEIKQVIPFMPEAIELIEERNARSQSFMEQLALFSKPILPPPPLLEHLFKRSETSAFTPFREVNPRHAVIAPAEEILDLTAEEILEAFEESRKRHKAESDDESSTEIVSPDIFNP